MTSTKRLPVPPPDGQRRPPGHPAGRRVVAAGEQRDGGALHRAGQPGGVRQRQLLPGLDTATDDGELDDDNDDDDEDEERRVTETIC